MMQLTLSVEIIQECLADDLLSVRMERQDSFGFQHVRIFFPGNALPEEDTLYLCRPDRLRLLPPGMEPNICLITTECPEAETQPNVFILKKNTDLVEIADRLMALFERANMCSHKLKDAVIAEDGVQALFQLAKEFFPNCLVVMVDSAYNLVARTRETVENEYLEEILQRNFYNKDDLDLMAAAGYFEDEQKYKVPILYRAESTISGVPFLVRSFRRSGATVFFVGCYFIDAEPTFFEQTCYLWFTDALGKYMFVHLREDEALPIQQKMIEDLINGERRDQDFLYDRCLRLHIPYQGEYRLGLIRGKNTNEMIAAQIVNQLRIYCSVKNYGIFQHHESILILFHDWHRLGVKEQAEFEEDWLALLQTLKSNQIRMGVSLSFPDISGFSLAYKQAARALCQGEKFGEAGERAYFFSRYYLHDMLSVYEDELPLEATYVRYLEDLKDERSGNTLDNLTLLYVYLASERNVALTARRVHMHRNGVLYRIDKIRDALGLDLDSPDVRFRLLFSFKVLEHLGRFRASPLQSGGQLTEQARTE